MDRYRMEIQELRRQLETKDKASKDEEAEKARELEAEQRHGEQMLEMQLARTALKERIEHLNRLILSSKSLGVNATRSFSSLSMQRASVGTATGGLSADAQSVRSARSSTATLEAPPTLNHRSSSGSVTASLRATATPSALAGHDEDDDSLGENGDGIASKDLQIRALQADLADKNRYISTLEKRLLQARRSSHSRVSMTFSARAAALATDEGGVEVLLREKDAEITELRARLDDKERMVSALRSAARKRDMADLRIDTSVRRSSLNATRDNRSPLNGAAGGQHHKHRKSNSLSPLGALSPGPDGKKVRSVDEMTKMLDEMITERVQQSGGGGGPVGGTTKEERVDSGIVVGKSEKRRSIARIQDSPRALG
jgi:centromeric protein E